MATSRAKLRPSDRVEPRIHVRGDHRLDSVLDFVAFAARQAPLGTLLDEAPRRLQAIFRADVVSVYLLEGDGDTLVMRGNVGFPEAVIGHVRLGIGEGMTGLAVELLRPVSAVTAQEHRSYRYFPELREERFPVFAAIPVLGRRGPLGAIVLQRAAVAFSDADIELAVALAATISAGVRTADLIDSMRDRHLPRKAGGGTRKLTLPGHPVVPGKALGAVAALKRPPARPKTDRSPDDVPRLRAAFDVAEKALQGLSARADHGDRAAASFLHTYVEIVSDARLRGETLRLCESGLGVAEALSRVVRAVARSAATAGSPFLEERARDIEDLCDALSMIALDDARVAIPSRAILVGDELTVFDVLVTARTRPVGVALSERAGASSRTRVLAELMGVPSIVGVGGLFRWVESGDIVVVDADHGLLIVNPSRSEVAGVREARRSEA